VTIRHSPRDVPTGGSPIGFIASPQPPSAIDIRNFPDPDRELDDGLRA
jgi:hypothetical protein